ncbi:tRNA uridine-5-carboxymethylaminomethyl(34) synthesis GTPase MnmE [Marinoscillum sp. MHG1-6]|uniref:tRNA uridine-5-carboxymethylaminomethyl(34) synthesis GTPase MnmE n=1 Tax=Marinoscillum sp. MHG1-6 TaxID=2959627 RepID=UPI002158855A|nr:tRNA uridine-5-carboxymethylaminomethyl(34) synthesis GTPase MnmE [Marinoscillum sp. MHG1-6]
MKFETIVALATPAGIGAIGVIRVSGPETFTIVNRVFKGKDISKAASHTIHFGTIRNGDHIIDEVLVSLFRAPNSFTREDVIEISCHGSNYIIQQLINLLLKEGCQLAKPGEFTQRAFVNGRFDLAQAEAVADLIAAENESMHDAAMSQMRGGFSLEIKQLREKLVHFASMIELELDFSEEDVEFASRDDLKSLIYELKKVIFKLTESFALGNAIKNGIPTVIAGKPNAGKSTLLNALLNEEKAIVSDIPGTTRDVIEDVINVDGIAFRFVDTAGIRTTEDHVEAIGVERTHARMKDASVILYMIDLKSDNLHDLDTQLEYLEELGVPYLLIGNKMDQAQPELKTKLEEHKGLLISASQKENLENLKEALKTLVSLDSFKTGNTVVTNLRHYESLRQTDLALDDVLTGIDNQVTNDFVAMDIRNALHHLGLITGEITTDDLLENIFSKFCIGK